MGKHYRGIYYDSGCLRVRCLGFHVYMAFARDSLNPVKLLISLAVVQITRVSLHYEFDETAFNAAILEVFRI